MTSTSERAVHRPGLRRPDPRTVGFLLVIVVFIAAILAVSDVLSRVGSQSLIARAIQRDLRLAQRPDVDVHGLFFIPEVVSGDYSNVEIATGPIDSGPLRIAHVDAHLHQVHLRFHDVLVRHVTRILIGRTAENATLRYSDIDAYLKSIGTPVSISPGKGGQVKFTGTVTVLGRPVSVSALGRVTARVNTLFITPTQVDTGLGVLDSATRLLLGAHLSIAIPLQQLPFSQEVTGVRVHPQDITVHAQGRDIAIQPNG